MTPVQVALWEFISSEILHGSSKVRIGVDSPLIEEGILDSLGLQQLVTFLEQEYDIELEDDHLVLENFETIGAIAQLVKSIRG